MLIVGDSEHGCGDVTGDKRGDEKHWMMECNDGRAGGDIPDAY